MSGGAQCARLGFTIGASGRCQQPDRDMGVPVTDVNIAVGNGQMGRI